MSYNLSTFSKEMPNGEISLHENFQAFEPGAGLLFDPARRLPMPAGVPIAVAEGAAIVNHLL